MFGKILLAMAASSLISCAAVMDHNTKSGDKAPVGGEPSVPFGGQGYDIETYAGDNQIKLMSYNLENLFDAEHDEGRSDYYYLPTGHPKKSGCESQGSYAQSCFANDWTEDKVRMKLDQLALTIKRSGSIPDIIGVQEVENGDVLSRLGTKLGYTKHLITDGPDERGIEVGFLYKEDKLELVTHKIHDVDETDPQGNNTRPTRNVLEAIFSIKGKSGTYLAVYVNHWPSQGTPMSGWKRSNAAKAMKAAIDDTVSRYGDRVHIVALGDFNTLPTDRPHPFHSVVFNSDWENALENDVQWSYNEDTKIKSGQGRSRYYMPEGTYFYRTNKTWNLFDRFFPSKNLNDGTGLEVLHNTYRIITAPETTEIVDLNYTTQNYTQKIMVPNRFNYNGRDTLTRGASDHFAITVLLGW